MEAVIQNDPGRRPASGRIEALLTDAGLSRADVSLVSSLDPEARADFLIGRFTPALSGRPLAGLLKALRILGDWDKAADFLAELIKGPAVPAQLLALRMAERPEFRAVSRISRALLCYQSDFDNLTHAWSWYNDRGRCSECRRPSCGDFEAGW